VGGSGLRVIGAVSGSGVKEPISDVARRDYQRHFEHNNHERYSGGGHDCNDPRAITVSTEDCIQSGPARDQSGNENWIPEVPMSKSMSGLLISEAGEVFTVEWVPKQMKRVGCYERKRNRQLHAITDERHRSRPDVHSTKLCAGTFAVLRRFWNFC
jgi:hypothetical protein